MYLLLSLLLPLIPVLISASGPEKDPTLPNRRNGGCDLLEIFTDNTGLIQCGPPGWGIEPDCICCGGVTACVNVIQTCGTADGAFVCYGYGAYSTPSPAAPSNSPAPPTSSPAPLISSPAPPISSPAPPLSSLAPFISSTAPLTSSLAAPAGTNDNSVHSISSTATAPNTLSTNAAASSPTSSKGPSLGPPGTSAASIVLQRADVIKVAFVTWLLLVFCDFL